MTKVPPSQPATDREKREPANWFERHPKKSLTLIVLGLMLGLVGLLLIAEKLVETLASPQDYRPRVKRHIRLREYPPFHVGFAYNPERPHFNDRIIHRIDDNGFIIPSKIHDNPDLTLVFLGGSSTECFNMPEDQRFPYLVGRLLEEKTGLKINSYNGAMAGNNSLHSLNILLNKVIPLQPRLVVMMHNINDLVILLYENSYWNQNKYKSPLVAYPATWETAGKYLQESVHVLRDLLIPALYAHFKEWKRNLGGKVSARGDDQDEFAAVRDRPARVDRERLQEEFRRNLETFISICQAQQLTPVLLTQPSRLKENPDPEILTPIKQRLEARQGITYQQFRELFLAFNQVIRETGARHLIPVIDLAGKIPPEKEYLEDVVHLTEKGSVLVAQVVSQALLPYIK